MMVAPLWVWLCWWGSSSDRGVTGSRWCHPPRNYPPGNESISWMWPPPSNSDHQDYYIFRIGDPNLNLNLPLLLGGGHTQSMEYMKNKTSHPTILLMVQKSQATTWDVKNPINNAIDYQEFPFWWDMVQTSLQRGDSQPLDPSESKDCSVLCPGTCDEHTI